MKEENSNHDDKRTIRVVRKIYPQIYAYILPDLNDHQGWQKVGYTERRNVDDRIREQTQTAAAKLDYQKLWSASTVNPTDNSFFTDHDLHKYYVKNGIQQSQKQNNGGFGSEWFYFDGTPEKSKELFNNYASHDYAGLANPVGGGKSYDLRPEQRAAVEQTLAYASEHQTTDFDNPNDDAKFLWNAKPRFGKTLTAYDFAKRFDAKNVLIVTNRPAIANSWYDDYCKFIDGYYFISTADSLKERPTITRDQFISRSNARPDDRQITFLSMQDLKGGKAFGGKFDKLEWVAQLKWDLLIIDEAHEGVDTERTDTAFSHIKRRFTLYLSGTPFKALANNDFKNEGQIFNWTYLDEQKAKQAELARGDDAGQHVDLPDLRLFTYKMSDMIAARMSDGVELDDGQDVAFAFNLNDMFSVDDNGRFVHEKEIKIFLDQLSTNEKYPFSTPELRNELKHTFWLVGNRVAAAKAMRRLLKQNPVFRDYEIIVAAGDGRADSDDDTTEEEMANYRENEKAYDRVKKAIATHDKTITLSVGQLTTGVTVKEWSAVLMLSDIKSEPLYTQAIFRSQNPYQYVGDDGNIYRKKSAYVFDFSPNRVLEVYDKFANNLQAKVAEGKATESERNDNVAELLNYFPVLAEDKYGRMVELDADQVLTFPKAIIAKAIVDRGFVTNLLFKNISNVYNIPREVMDSLNKMKSTNDTGRVERESKPVDHDPNRREKMQRRISVNNAKLFGDKVYGKQMRQAVAEITDQPIAPSEIKDKLVQKYQQIVAEPMAVYRETYAPTKTKLEKLEKEQIAKVEAIADEFISQDLTKQNTKLALADKMAELIEKDLPSDTVEHEEEDNYADEEKTELNQIRAKLRTFGRAIPSFVMASQNADEITLDNIENTVSDKDFEELFTETQGGGEVVPFTKDDFRMLRSPRDYIFNCPEEIADGFFDRYTFNAAIREFEETRNELADYLDPDVTGDIFSKIRPLKTNQIFTPRRIVNLILDKLEANNPGIFSNPDITFCDLHVKSGMFMTETAKRLYRGLADIYPDRKQRIKHILEKQLYGFAPTEIIYHIARKYIYGNFVDVDTSNLKFRDLTESFRKGDTLGLKFDVVIGNPPYQDGNNQVYTLFYKNALHIGDYVSMIFPTGWRGVSNVNLLSNMNNVETKRDSQIVDIDDIHNAFPGVAGAEWTNIIQWRHGYDNNLGGRQRVLSDGKDAKVVLLPIDKADIPKPNEIISICADVDKLGESKIASSGSARKPYGFEADPLDNPGKYNLSVVDNPDSDTVRLFGRKKGVGRTYIYIKRSGLPKVSPMLDKWKLFVVKAWGNMDEKDGYLGGSYSEIIVAKPGDCCSEMYIEFGPYDNEQEAENARKYFYTKFFRAVFYKNKTSQNTARDTYKSVPVQDFTANSDIDWSQSIVDIDKQLYHKYGLSQHEIDFIEQHVKPME